MRLQPVPSSSSTTMTFSTLFANARIFSTGRGWIMPSFSTVLVLAADLLDILIAGRTKDQADGMVGAVYHAVHVRGLRPGLQRERPLLDDGVPRLAQAGIMTNLAISLFIGDRGDLLRSDVSTTLCACARVHILSRTGVSNFSSGELVGQLGERQRLRGVGRLEHRRCGGNE